MESTTKNFFENPMGNAGGVGLGAGVGGLIGAWLGNNGVLGGNREPAVTPDQLQATINGLQGQMSTDAIQGHLSRIQGQIAGTAADSTIALGAGIAGVKDAVVSAASQNALALCGLGHTVQAGFASTNQTILLEGARTRELAQQTEINRLLALTAQQHSDAGHARTQVLLSQVINQGAGSGN